MVKSANARPATLSAQLYSQGQKRNDFNVLGMLQTQNILFEDHLSRCYIHAVCDSVDNPDSFLYFSKAQGAK